MNDEPRFKAGSLMVKSNGQTEIATVICYSI